MSNPVAERIVTAAKAEASKVSARAHETAKEIHEEATQAAQAAAEAIKERAGETARQKAQGILADARLDVRLKELAVRRELMEAAITRALEEVLSLPVERFRQLALKEIVQGHFAGRQELVTGPEDRDVWNGAFVEEVNAALGDNGSVDLAMDEKLPGRRYLLRQGRKFVVCGPESALGSRREELEEEVARVLFGEKGE